MSEKVEPKMVADTVIIELKDVGSKEPWAKVKPKKIDLVEGGKITFVYADPGRVTLMFPMPWFVGGQVHEFGGAIKELTLEVKMDIDTDARHKSIPYQVYCSEINKYGKAASPPTMILGP